MSFRTAKIPFISTTGFYIQGIDADDPNLISATSEYKSNQENQSIYCLQQYRSTDDYIYNYWRKDMRFHFKADCVSLEMPDSIWEKVSFVWFKTGSRVIKYDKNLMEKDWTVGKEDGQIKFTSGEKQISENTFREGFSCFWNTSIVFGIPNKLPLSLLLLLLSSMIVYGLWVEIKIVLNVIFKKLKSQVKKHKVFYSRIFSVFAGIVTVFILLETSLRIIGYYHEKQNINKNYPLATDADRLIVCLGDSFTEGIGSSSKNDYPAVLDRLVKAEFGTDYQVANFGQSGKNTKQIKDEFINYLSVKNPEVVILMAGSANYWNYYGFEDKNEFIYNIRTFKLIKLLWNQVFSDKTVKETVDRSNCFSGQDYVLNRNKFDEKLYELALIADDDSAKNLTVRDSIYSLILSKSTQEFSAEYRNSLDSDLQQLLLIYDFNKGSDIDIKLLTSNYYRSVYFYLLSTKSEHFFKMTNLFMALSECPYLEDAYYDLIKENIYLPISKPDFDENKICIADTILYYKTKLGLILPGAINRKVFIEESIDLNIENGKINRWVEEDLEEIIVTCRQKGIRLIIMTYPFKYQNPLYAPVNQILIDLSKKYHISIVDNFSIFDKISVDKDSYFVADGHCSDKGYKLIAENLFKLIKSEKMLVQPKEKVNAE